MKLTDKQIATLLTVLDGHPKDVADVDLFLLEQEFGSLDAKWCELCCAYRRSNHVHGQKTKDPLTYMSV